MTGDSLAQTASAAVYLQSDGMVELVGIELLVGSEDKQVADSP